MAIVETTKMSSRGQVVIPENIRRELGLVTGSQFVVMGDKDVVILKTITPTSMDQFDAIIAEARQQAKKAGLKKKDIELAIKQARGKSESRP